MTIDYSHYNIALDGWEVYRDAGLSSAMDHIMILSFAWVVKSLFQKYVTVNAINHRGVNF